MTEKVNFETINVIPAKSVQVIQAIHTSVNQETGEPSAIVLSASIDRNKANSNLLSMPIRLPASNYRSKEHMKILELFKSGEPFVAVMCDDLTVYRKKKNSYRQYYYYAYATNFSVIDWYFNQGGTD